MNVVGQVVRSRASFCLQFIRHKNRKQGGVFFTRNPNPQKPTPSSVERRVLEAVTRPILPEHFPDVSEKCGRLQERKHSPTAEENLFEDFLVRRCREVFEDNRAVFMCQMYSMKTKEMSSIWRSLISADISLAHDFPEQVLRKAVVSTRYENLLPIFSFRTRLVTCRDLKVKEFMNITRKMSHILVLGGIVDDVIYSHAGLLHIASLPDLQTLQGQTCGILNMAAAKTLNLLQQNPQQLSRNLDQYKTDQTKHQTISQ